MARRRISIVALIAAFLFGTLNAATMSTAMAMGSLVVASDSMMSGCDGSPSPPQKATDCFCAACGAFFAAVLPATELDLSFPARPVPVSQISACYGLSPGPDPEPPRAADRL